MVGGWWVGGGVESKFSVQLRPKLNNSQMIGLGNRINLKIKVVVLLVEPSGSR